MTIFAKAVFVFSLFALFLTGAFVTLNQEGRFVRTQKDPIAQEMNSVDEPPRNAPVSTEAALSTKEEKWQETLTPETASVSTPGALQSPPKTTQAKESQVTPLVTLNHSAVITLTNKERAKEGFAPLSFDAGLFAMAQAKAADMFARQYFAHESPSNETISDLAKQYGYAYLNLGENLALGDFDSNEELILGWMNSPGHRANIMNDTFTEIGVGIVRANYQGREVWFAVQEFGRPMGACPEPDLALEKKITTAEGEIRVRDAELGALRSELNKPGQSTEEYNANVQKYNALVAQYSALVATIEKEVDLYNAEVAQFNACVG